MPNTAPMTVEEYCRRNQKAEMTKAMRFGEGTDSRLYYMGRADAFGELLSMLKFLEVRKHG